MPKTQQQTQIPFSMEVAAGIVAEHCYQDRKFHRQMLKDSLATASQLISKETKSSVDLKEILPNCKLHVLKNNNKRWHIVLPFKYHGETPSLENGLLTEEDLEQVTGGIFGVATATGYSIGAIATNIAVVFTTVGAVAAPLGSFAGSAWTATTGTFLSTGVVAAITAGIVASGVALTTGITAVAIAGLDAADIISFS